MTGSNQPTLAIIIPIYGHPSLLIDAIESALRQQTKHDYRIVLVNDGCPSPQSDQVCRQYAQVHPQRILYVKKRNGGLSSARNRGIRVALETWPSIRAVYLLDADNRIHPHLLERGYALLEADPEAGWIFPDIHMFGSSRQFSDTTGDFKGLQLLARNFCEAGSLVRREVFEAGVWYDESMKLGYEDWEFWLHDLEAGFKGKHGPALGFRYRKRPESMLANSERDHQEITGYIRRKHAKLFTPRRAKQFEQTELPRFAIYLAERHELILTSDVRDWSQRQTWAEFLRALRRHETYPLIQQVPPTVIVTCEKTLQLLLDRGLAANLLWLLEADLEDHQWFFLQLEQLLGLEVRLEISQPTNPTIAERNDSVLCALPTAVLRDCLQNADQRSLESVIADITPAQVVGRRLCIEHTERPQALMGGAGRRLAETIEQLHTEFHATARWPVNPRRLFFRTPLDARCLSRMIFQAPAPPPLHIATGERHIGYVVPLAEWGGVERVVCNMARENQRQGWRVHLFVVGANRACLLAEFKDVFDTIHLIPENRTEPARLVSLLSTMNVVVNHHTVALHAALGDLKRLGVKLVMHLHLVDLSVDGMPCGLPYLAADYEHSLHKMTVISRSMQQFMLAKGVPPEKLVYVPNAASFEVPPERVDAALLERAQRGAEEPLRVLFMARFDFQKGLDRLIDLVGASEQRMPQTTWRIVGKTILGVGRPDLDRQILDKYLHQPAKDVFSLSRHYCWADVLVLVSRWEGAPLSILEAQQLGCVPIATNCGAVGELIDDGKTGFLLENTENTSAITERALHLFAALQHDRGRLVEMAQQGAAVRRANSWRHTMREFSACLDAWFPTQGAA